MHSTRVNLILNLDSHLNHAGIRRRAVGFNCSKGFNSSPSQTGLMNVICIPVCKRLYCMRCNVPCIHRVGRCGYRAWVVRPSISASEKGWSAQAFPRSRGSPKILLERQPFTYTILYFCRFHILLMLCRIPLFSLHQFK